MKKSYRIYDQIFPLNQRAFQFLAQTLPQNGEILDLGAGTGTMAVRLAEEAFQVTALEPDVKMAACIQKKNKQTPHPCQIETKSMQELQSLSAYFDGMYCIGNTLAHAADLEEIQSILMQAYQKLRADGIFIAQTVNFDAVLTHTEYRFPEIQRADLTFRRTYTGIQKQSVTFTTEIETGQQTDRQTTRLYPILSAELTYALENCGFREIRLYGSYLKQPFTQESPAVIALARK